MSGRSLACLQTKTVVMESFSLVLIVDTGEAGGDRHQRIETGTAALKIGIKTKIKKARMSRLRGTMTLKKKVGIEFSVAQVPIDIISP